MFVLIDNKIMKFKFKTLVTGFENSNTINNIQQLITIPTTN